MFATLAPIALLALSVFTQAAPIPHGRRASNAPAHWATKYLESYDVYHTRYVAVGCSGQHGSRFFDMCCHPMLAGELLSSKPAECTPSASAPAAEESCDSDDTPVAASVTVAAAVVVAPTTSSAAPAPAATTAAAPAPPSSGTMETGGSATYFWQNGNPGACGNYNPDSLPLVAVPYKWWATSDGQKSDKCGKYVDIKRKSDGRTVKAVVADLCPTCTTDNSLDLSWGAFSQIATADEGMVAIEWSWSS